MAKWNISPKTQNSSLRGAINYDDKESFWRVEQDETPYVDWAKDERETHSSKHTHLRKFATIPDIVAIEILTKYGLDVHDPLFMSDTDKLAKLKQIILQDYKYLVVSS